MTVKSTHELFIVTENIDRYHAYRAAKRGKAGAVGDGLSLERICQGVYMHAGADPELIFNRYGLRIAHYLFPQASLSFSTAWFKAPRMGRVFVTGQYQYARALFDGSDRFAIVQSIGEVDPSNKKLHTLEAFKDKLGKFKMLVDTPELTLLNMMSSTKRHSEKHLGDAAQNALIAHLIEKHHSKAAVLSALEKVAIDAGRENEFRRVINVIYPPPNPTSYG